VKRVKVLGSLAAVAAFAMALLGPSTAMGETTALCKADESPCNSAVSHVHYLSQDMEVESPEMTYKCDALFLGTVYELGAPQAIEGKFTYTNCNGDCSRTEENGPAVLNFLKTGHELAEGTGESLVHINCPGFFNCNYTLENVTGNIKGPLLSSEKNGEIRFEKTLLTHESGVLCPSEAFLSATFVPLSPTYISS
jgi:hypothetical protein